MTLVLIPGAGGDAAYWDHLVPALESRGHEAIAVDIPEDDAALGLPEYAQIVDDAIGERTGVVLVAQSLGGLTAPMVTKRSAVAMIVLLNAMIPLPGEHPDDWWPATGSGAASERAAAEHGYSSEFDLETYFLHDLAPDVVARLWETAREPSDTPWGQPCAFERWPDVPIKVVIGRDDRMFPAEFQRAVATQRLDGLINPDADIDVLPGGHLVALSQPDALADLLASYVDLPKTPRDDTA